MQKYLIKTMIVAALMLTPSAVAIAADTAPAADAATAVAQPDLTAVRAKIEAKDYTGAIADLTPLLAGSTSADVYNLMGFSLRKSGDLDQAKIHYAKALELDANHKGALEYQGELFLQIGDVAGAKANLVKLAALCPTGCEERVDLEAALKAAGQ
jgi:tetratricopeptide (TPR) repeat protein